VSVLSSGSVNRACYETCYTSRLAAETELNLCTWAIWRQIGSRNQAANPTWFLPSIYWHNILAGFIIFLTTVCWHCQTLRKICCLSVIKDWWHVLLKIYPCRLDSISGILILDKIHSFIFFKSNLSKINLCLKWRDFFTFILYVIIKFYIQIFPDVTNLFFLSKFYKACIVSMYILS